MAGIVLKCHELLGWALLHGRPVAHKDPAKQAFLETLRNRLVFLMCVAHMQNNLVQSNPACTLRRHVLSR